MSQATGRYERTSVSEKVQHYAAFDATIPLRSLGDGLSFELYRVVVRRQPFAVVWNVLCLCRILQLQSYKGVPSKWAFNCRQPWLAWMEEAGVAPADHVMQSALSNSVNSQRSSTACLPSPSLSTAGLVVCLCRWAYCTPQFGGLRTVAARQLAEDFLFAVLASAVARRCWRLQLRWVAEWSAAWPCSEPSSADACFLVSSSLAIDLTAWRNAVAEGSEVHTLWWGHVITYRLRALRRRCLLGACADPSSEAGDIQCRGLLVPSVGVATGPVD